MRATALAAAALLVLAGCGREASTGYVEIKTVPSSARPLALYLDADRVEPPKNGVAVLRQPVGTVKLQLEGDAGRFVLCQIAVRKNRITTVTISALDRPPRCQCGRTGINDARTCIG